jgi:outer membrane protein OmpA-like peptidoglycan-associated protein
MATILDSLRSLVTPDLLAQAATALGESQGNVSRGLEAAFPAILAGLLSKSNDTGAMRQIMELLGDPSLDSNLVRNPASMVSGAGLAKSPIVDLGQRFLSALFGPQMGSIAGALASQAGIKSQSASTLLGLAAPLVMSVLGDRVRRDGLNAAGLTNLLASQKESILREAPAGLAGLLGLGAPSRMPIGDTYTAPERSRSWWPAAALVGLVALAGLWGWLRRPTPQQTAQAPANQVATRSVTDVPDVGAFTKRLPTNFELRAPATGIEKQVVVFIEDPARGVDVPTWFNFDRLLFETGSAQLKPESREQLRNVAEILKAYPKVKAKVGGYTDNVGDPAANMKLSQDRATNVMTELVVLGVAADRLSAEGYGEQNPVADNSTEAGRQQNRRIALRVTEK